MHRINFINVGMLLIMVLSGCAPIAREAATSSEELTPLKVLLLPYDSFAPFFIAQEEGYFAEQGLDVEFVKLDGSSDAIALVAQGEIDVWAGSIGVGLFNVMAKVDNVKIVADKGFIDPDGCTYFSGLVGAEPDIATVAELQGKNIGGRRTALQGYYLAKLLSQADLSFSDVEIADIPNAAKAEALANRSVSLVVAGEPWVTRMLEETDAVLWQTAQEVIPDFQFGAIVYGPSLLEQNPDAGQRFMVAYRQAVKQYNEGKTDRNLEIIAQYTEQEIAFVTETCWPPLRADSFVDLESISDFQTWAVASGDLDALLEPSAFWDPTFLEQANEQLGE